MLALLFCLLFQMRTELALQIFFSMFAEPSAHINSVKNPSKIHTRKNTCATSALFSRPHDPRDGPRQPFPFRFLGDQLLLAGGGEAIEFELAFQILTGWFPLRGDPAFPLQTVQCGI